MANQQKGNRKKLSHASRITHYASLLPLLLTPYSLLPALYLLISLFATWPLITHLHGWVPGWGDWGQNMWALWWTRHAVLSLAQSPFYTTYLFHPEGVTLLFHPLDVSDGLLAIPLYGLFGGDVSYNLMILLSFVVGGWGTYLLALYLTGHRAASFVAGLVFILSPYHFLRIDLGHLNLSTIQWIPFFTLFLLKFLRGGSIRSALFAIFFLVFTALNSWYYVVYCGLLALAFLFLPDQSQSATNSKQQKIHYSSLITHHFLIRLARIAVVLLAALLILSPLIIPMLRLLGSTILIGAHDPLRHSVDVLSFFVPGPPSSWAGGFEDTWLAYAAQNREPGASAYLGYVVLGLSLISLIGRRKRREVIWWFVIAIGFSVLALGPQLQIGGQISGVSLPYQWLATLVPIFSITGIPGRFVVMTSLALAALSAYGLVTLINWLSAIGSRQPAVSGHLSFIIHHSSFITRPVMSQSGIIVIVSLLILLEYLALPLRLTPTTLPEIYTTISADTDSYAVLDIKWDANFLMHAQTIHGKPIVGGWLARLPEEQAIYLEQDSLDKAFLYLLLGSEQANQVDLATIQPAIQRALAERDVRYIINHSQAANDWLVQFVGWPVIFERDGVVVYGKN